MRIKDTPWSYFQSSPCIKLHDARGFSAPLSPLIGTWRSAWASSLPFIPHPLCPALPSQGTHGFSSLEVFSSRSSAQWVARSSRVMKAAKTKCFSSTVGAATRGAGWERFPARLGLRGASRWHCRVESGRKSSDSDIRPRQTEAGGKAPSGRQKPLGVRVTAWIHEACDQIWPCS